MVKFLSGKKVYLRKLAKKDCTGRYLDMANDAESLSFVEGIGNIPLTVANLKEYVESNNKSSALLLGIFENKTDIHVGNIRLSHIKPYHNSSMLGIIMHRGFIGKGYAFEASFLLVNHAFSVMNVHRIQINVVSKNIPAIGLYQKLGAVKEGVLREAFYFDNRYHDVIVYSLLKKEFFKDR